MHNKINNPTETELATFQRDGFLLIRNLASTQICDAIKAEVNASLQPLRGPAEFEVDVSYPGAPKDKYAEGADTPRRLLHAYGRHQVFRDWGTSSEVKTYLQALMQNSSINLVQSHHNCIMTKHPGYSSKTSWHQDFRYWYYDKPELVSVWLALGNEDATNGALSVIPGTHKQLFERDQLDRDLFLRDDIEENKLLLAQAVTLELQAGDVLFFHSQLFHAAAQNKSNKIKKALVFTYHTANNKPIPATKSARYPSIPI